MEEHTAPYSVLKMKVICSSNALVPPARPQLELQVISNHQDVLHSNNIPEEVRVSSTTRRLRALMTTTVRRSADGK